MKTLTLFLESIVPKANPDSKSKILNSNVWLIEFNLDGLPCREIGMKDDNPICRFPYKDDLGLFLDSNITHQEIKENPKFETISSAYFDSM